MVSSSKFRCVYIVFLFPYNFLLFFIVNYASLFLEFEIVANNIYNLWIHISYVIFYMFFVLYWFIQIFFSKVLKTKKKSAGCLVNLKNDVYRRGLEKNFIDFTILGLFHIQPTRLVGNLVL